MTALGLWLLIFAYALVWRGYEALSYGSRAPWPDTGGIPVGILASLDPRGGGLGGLSGVRATPTPTCGPGEHWVGSPVNGGCVADPGAHGRPPIS